MSEHQNSPGTKVYHCSFCTKSQDEIRKIIAGRTAFICDECVRECCGILDQATSPLVNAPYARVLREWAWQQTREVCVTQRVEVARKLAEFIMGNDEEEAGDE